MDTVKYVLGEGKQEETIQKVMEIAKQVNGRRKNRILFLSDVEDLFDCIAEHPDAGAIRSYSKHGFVANAYKWRAEIVYCQATRNEDGSWSVGVYVTDAKRPYGNGSLLTVDGRAK